ncbi:MAG: methionine gamma-lyase family protein [Oscillospiraceae bacterium]|jgi:cystathionine beta-lyase family protein involved in aluminum resistance|nr:methionine gamma-lyase family protein [Oscillospiraceae bacterium]
MRSETDLFRRAHEKAALSFPRIDLVASVNTERVLDAFIRHRVSDACFAFGTGYAYGERGRDTLDKLWADVFFAEDALVRVQFVSGTHAIACALRAARSDAQGYLSLVGEPYDTVKPAAPYNFVPEAPDGKADRDAVRAAIIRHKPRAVLIQRSCGYRRRKALSVADIAELVGIVKDIDEDIVTVCDNCYGEFCEESEPCAAGVDMTAGSLIKNPGGGLCVAGGYIAGKKYWVDKAAQALTAPGIGRECGGSLGLGRSLYQGLFLAPHVTAQALKTALFAASLMELLGYEVCPRPEEERYEITQAIKFGRRDILLSFVRAVQHASPVDSFAEPQPWNMPGYDDEVVMAAGTFVQGASIELSCDAPMREPYTAYLQGGLTYESGRLAVWRAAVALEGGAL